MVIQNIIFPSLVCDREELYYHRTGDVCIKETGLSMKGQCKVSTDTYMNLFDYITWRKYTGISQWIVELYAKGQGKILLVANCNRKIEVLNCKGKLIFKRFDHRVQPGVSGIAL